MQQEARAEKRAIVDADQLLRRVRFTNPDHVKPDGSASSFAFTPRKHKGEKALSVDAGSMTTHERSIKKAAEYRLYVLQVKEVREMLLSVCHDPCPAEEPENQAHTLIAAQDGRPAGCTDVPSVNEGPIPGITAENLKRPKPEVPLTITAGVAKKLARASRRLNYPDRC